MEPLARLIAIMARLRDPASGCPWDREQSFASIVPYTIEEAYEVADAVQRGDMGDLKEELGDLLLQVVFHARMAEEAGHFGFADVAGAIADKMERRHPHIFGDEEAADAEAVVKNWEALKAAEKSRDSGLSGVALALPALLRAEKLGKRAARTGFDWPDAQGTRAKIAEELAELDEARTPEHQAEELGDLLFVVAQHARKLGLDPEAALRAANAKFERRFRAMEQAAGDSFPALEPDAKEALWAAAKAAERAS